MRSRGCSNFHSRSRSCSYKKAFFNIKTELILTCSRSTTSHTHTQAPFVLVARTMWFDAVIMEANKKMDVKQIVILAAGLDARAYRLPFAEGTAVFEVDCKSCQEWKKCELM